MILRKSKFHLQIFLTSNIAQSTTSVDVGAVLREEGLVKAVQNAKHLKGSLLQCAWLGLLYAFLNKTKSGILQQCFLV